MYVPTSKIISSHKIIPAFGFSTAEMAKAIVETCEEENSPVILQTSQSDAKFLSPEIASSIVWALGQKVKVDVALQLDHAVDLELIKKCVEVGYGSIMLGFDELDFEKNVEEVCKIKEMIQEAVPCAGCQAGCDRRQEILIEAGLAQFDRAKEFVEKTGVDVLAPVVDNKINLSELEKIMKKVSVPIALHGVSNKPDEEVKQAIKLGVKKINWSTCLREAWVEGLRESLSDEAKLEKPRPSELLEKSVENVKKVVKGKVGIIKSTTDY